MADRELIAAILTAGMLPTLEIPQSRMQGRSGSVTRAESEAIQHAVDHAFGLYRLVLNGLGVDPFAVEAAPGAQPRAPAAAARNGATGLHWDDTPHSKEPASQPLGAFGGAASDSQDRREGASTWATRPEPARRVHR
jgi:hypothetical protein